MNYAIAIDGPAGAGKSTIAKRLAKERKRKRKALEQEAERMRKEAELLEKYRQKYLKQKAKADK